MTNDLDAREQERRNRVLARQRRLPREYDYRPRRGWLSRLVCWLFGWSGQAP